MGRNHEKRVFLLNWFVLLNFKDNTVVCCKISQRAAFKVSLLFNKTTPDIEQNVVNKTICFVSIALLKRIRHKGAALRLVQISHLAKKYVCHPEQLLDASVGVLGEVAHHELQLSGAAAAELITEWGGTTGTEIIFTG